MYGTEWQLVVLIHDFGTGVDLWNTMAMRKSLNSMPLYPSQSIIVPVLNEIEVLPDHLKMVATWHLISDWCPSSIPADVRIDYSVSVNEVIAMSELLRVKINLATP